jgi:hypothetical protein
LHIRHHEPRFDSHIPNLTRHQLLIISDPTISISNPTDIQSYPTRSRLPIFYNSYEIPDPTRSAIDSSEFDPTANYHHSQLSIPRKPRLYTPQSAFKPQKITPEHDPSSGSESRFHKTFLGFFTSKPRAQIHLKSINPKSHSLTQNTTNPKK